MVPPILTVIVVSYNNEKQIGRCLDSIVVETKGFPIQLIIIDNASTDNTVTLTKSRMVHDTRYMIRLIENQTNLGYSKAVNQGYNKAEGEVVLLLNADTVLTSGCIQTLLDFEKSHRPVMVGPRLLNPDGTIQSSVFHLPTVAGAIKEFWLGKKGVYSKYTPSGNLPTKVEAILGGAMLISKVIIERVGGFDEKYFMYFEDLDYCRKVGKANYPIYYLPEAKIIHEHGASGKGLADFENQWKRLIPSSIVYHGRIIHYLVTLVILTKNAPTRLFDKFVKIYR